MSAYQPLTPAVFHVLLALADGEKHGYAIMKSVEDHTGGTLKMGAGTSYGTLAAAHRRRLGAGGGGAAGAVGARRDGGASIASPATAARRLAPRFAGSKIWCALARRSRGVPRPARR